MIITKFLQYLLESTVYISLIALCYFLVFKKMTHFVWNRWYLVCGLLISIILPIVPFLRFLPLGEMEGMSSKLFKLNLQKISLSSGPDAVSHYAEISESWFGWTQFLMIIFFVYMTGFVWKLTALLKNLIAVKRVVRSSEFLYQTDVYRLYNQRNIPTFSFFTGIFLGKDCSQLSVEEMDQILRHEEIHVRQKHSFDVLLFEMACVIFWFNPAVYFMKNALKLTHEFIVDSIVSGCHSNVPAYGRLLVKLSSFNIPISPVHSFSGPDVLHRISMLTKTKTSPMHKLKFFYVLPIIIGTVAVCSFVKRDISTSDQKITLIPKPNAPTIRSVKWTGNKIYSDAELSNMTGIKPGMLYDEKDLENRYYGMGREALASIYMDQGYLFFRVETSKTEVSQMVDLTLSIYEGHKVRIGKITVKGNKDVPEQEVLDKISINTGTFYNRAKLIETQAALAGMGKFDPQKIDIYPTPDEKSMTGDGGTVDIEFTLTRK